MKGDFHTFVINQSNPNMAGIYIHIPFCRQACYYCNFHFSVSFRNMDAFQKALLKEITMRSAFFKDALHSEASEGIDTIYIGGGTPSVLGTSELSKIFEQLGSHFFLENTTEVTLEANPDDMTVEKLLSLRQGFVNRLSIGIQSFSHADLRFLNRIHSPGQAVESVKNARKAGFDQLTIDLIYGTPTLSDTTWKDHLARAVDLGVPHVSAYALTVEKKTVLDHMISKGKAPPVSDEQCARQFDILCGFMEKHGYLHYEISNFALPGHFSKHNLSYWTGVPYLGLGPSAHSYIQGKRFWNVANTSRYIACINQGSVPADGEILSPVQELNEYVMTSLRTMWGCDLQKVEENWGSHALKDLEKKASNYLQSGLMTEKMRHLVLTRKGKFLADGIAANLFTIK